MVFITAFLFSYSVWPLSKYLQEEPHTATRKEMRGRADRVSTNGKSEAGESQQQCLSDSLLRLVWQASLHENAVSLKKVGGVL